MVTKITLTLLLVTVTFYISLRDHSSEGNQVKGDGEQGGGEFKLVLNSASGLLLWKLEYNSHESSAALNH